MDSKNRIRKNQTKTPVKVEKVYTSEFQKEGTKSAQLRQVVTNDAYYPSKQIENSHQDNVFSVEDFGFEEKHFSNQEERVAWIDVPQSAGVDDVEAKLPEESCLYRILSNTPIITDSQDFAIKSEEVDLTLDTVANKQVIRYGKGHPKEGQIILDMNGKPQYRAVFFSKENKDDVDLRDDDGSNQYMSPKIRAELTNAVVVEGQSI